MRQFNLFREERDAKTPISARIKLQKQEGSSEFTPFRVDKTTRPNLRALIQAFKVSGQVGLGFTTIDKGKGEHEPMLKSKNLWLTGGAVRDHLKGKTPRNYDLVTDATPSEIRLILSNCEQPFQEIKPKDAEMAQDERYADLPTNKGKRVFYASRWDGTGKEIETEVEINGEKFELATLGKHGKSRRVSPDKTDVATSVEEDSMGRDFTVNAMYIPLTQSDGENSELIDPHGGAHHLKSGQVEFINSALDKVRDDPMTAFRYVNTASKFGGLKNIPEKYKMAIRRHSDMGETDPADMKKQFVDGLESPDSDPRQYLGAMKELGLLSRLFPDLEFRDDPMPPDFKGDRWLAPAWILRDNDPAQVKKVLEGGGWSKQEANDVAYLVKIAGWAERDGFNPDKLKEIKNGGRTGLTKSKIREWLQMIGKEGDESESLFKDDAPRQGSGDDGSSEEDGSEMANIKIIGNNEGMSSQKEGSLNWGKMVEKLHHSPRTHRQTPVEQDGHFAGWQPLAR